MVARQPLATVREARYGYAVANIGSNPHITVLTDLTDLLQAIYKKGIALNLTYIRSIDIT
jgi:hypothetical protein